MGWLLDIVKIAAILSAAGILGNWFLKEVKQAKLSGSPWYAPYLTAPGILVVIVALLLPILAWLGQK